MERRIFILEILQSILGNIIGFVVGLVFCYGLRGVLRHFMGEESDADGTTAVIILSILTTMIIWLCITA